MIEGTLELSCILYITSCNTLRGKSQKPRGSRGSCSRRSTPVPWKEENSQCKSSTVKFDWSLATYMQSKTIVSSQKLLGLLINQPEKQTPCGSESYSPPFSLRHSRTLPSNKSAHGRIRPLMLKGPLERRQAALPLPAFSGR